jgi:hypothetical protein
MRFDLRGLRTLPALRARMGLRLMGAVAVAFFTFLAAYAIVGYYIIHGGYSGWSESSSLALVIPLFFLSVGVYLIKITGPGEDYVNVDDRGLSFVRPSGSSRFLGWADLRFRLRMQLTNGLDRHGSRSTPMIFVAGRFPAQTYITQEAYEAILRQAAAKGLTASTGPSKLVSGWSETVIARP